jgi:hypothetical protein
LRINQDALVSIANPRASFGKTVALDLFDNHI